MQAITTDFQTNLTQLMNKLKNVKKENREMKKELLNNLKILASANNKINEDSNYVKNL
jgi:hypothetical protein